MEFLLDKAALKGLSEEDQKAVKEQAFNQFLLGSVFGGRGIASGYDAVQGIIPGIQKQRQTQGLLQKVDELGAEFFPTQAQAGQRALAFEGRGPTLTAAQNQRTILDTVPDYANLQTRLGQLALTPGGAPIVQALSPIAGAFKPNVTDGVVTNIRNQATGFIPRADLKTGLTLGGNVQDGRINFETGAIPGFRSATARNTLTPLATNQEYVYDVNQNPIGVRTATGAIQSLTEIEAAKAVGQAAGQVERVRNRATGEMELVPRTTALNPPRTNQGNINQPNVNQPNIAQGNFDQNVLPESTSGAVVEASPGRQTLDKGIQQRFEIFSTEAANKAQTAGGRRFAAQQLYNLADRIQNDKLTGIKAGVYSYMNAIPGVGNMFEQEVVDATNMLQNIKKAQLETTAAQKGPASNLDVTNIEKSYAQITDTGFATKIASTIEIAQADKDDAKIQFVESYRGNPSQIATAWYNSTLNGSVFNHPKFNQLVTEQVNKWDQGGRKNAPILPAGFQFGTSKRTGQFIVKRPDGSSYTIGQ